MPVVTNATVKVNTFKTIYTLLNSNKPSGWTVLSSFPDSAPVFPCIVIEPAKVSIMSPTFRIDARKYDIEVELAFYVKASDRKEALDAGVDTVREVILNNEATFETNKLVLATDIPFDETNVNTIQVEGIKLHNSFAIIKLRKI